MPRCGVPAGVVTGVAVVTGEAVVKGAKVVVGAAMVPVHQQHIGVHVETSHSASDNIGLGAFTIKASRQLLLCMTNFGAAESGNSRSLAGTCLCGGG